MTYDSTKDTIEHIRKVQSNLSEFIDYLLRRSIIHDASKLDSPEKEMYDKFTPKLRGTEYGSKEYKEHLAAMGKALQHHYLYNSHHPESHENGIDGMSLLDLVEMLCDWYAASQRHDDGDIRKSIKINQERFGMSDQLTQILLNTCDDMEWDLT